MVLATEKKQKSILYDERSVHKVEPITKHIGLVYSGMGPDYRYFSPSHELIANYTLEETNKGCLLLRFQLFFIFLFIFACLATVTSLTAKFSSSVGVTFRRINQLKEKESLFSGLSLLTTILLYYP